MKGIDSTPSFQIPAVVPMTKFPYAIPYRNPKTSIVVVAILAQKERLDMLKVRLRRCVASPLGRLKSFVRQSLYSQTASWG